MTEKFTASNGYEIEEMTPTAGLYVNKVPFFIQPEQKVALREYFRDERDRELGRWRSPLGSKGYIVYPKVNGSVRVVEEITGQSAVVTRDSVNDDLDAWWNEVADTYFGAHPEKKPWHDAKPGEVWVLSYDCEEVVATLEKNGSWKRFDGEFESSGDLQYVRSARRIWPESKES